MKLKIRPFGLNIFCLYILPNYQQAQISEIHFVKCTYVQGYKD